MCGRVRVQPNGQCRRSPLPVMVLLQTRQTSSFVYMFDSLGDIVTEAVLCFRKGGLYMRETAYSMSVLVTAQLDASKFDTYDVDEDITQCVLVSLPLLCGLLRTANITDTLTLSLIEQVGGCSGTVMELCLLGETGNERVYCLPVHRIPLDDDRAHHRLGPGVAKEFDHVLHINTKHLTHMCTNVFPFASAVAIEVSGAQVSFTVESSDSLVSRARVTLGGKGAHKRPHASVTDTPPIRALFHTQRLALFAKALALHPVCNMYLAKDYPLVIEILINQLGKMRLCLMHLEEIDD
jgi:hypothetical protein